MSPGASRPIALASTFCADGINVADTPVSPRIGIHRDAGARSGQRQLRCARAVVRFRRDEREEAVIDFSVAKRLDARAVEAMTCGNQGLKDLAEYAKVRPAPS